MSNTKNILFHLFMSNPDRFLLLLLLLCGCLEGGHHCHYSLSCLQGKGKGKGCPTHQVGGVDDIRVPVAGHVVVRENYAACKRLKCPSGYY